MFSTLSVWCSVACDDAKSIDSIYISMCLCAARGSIILILLISIILPYYYLLPYLIIICYLIIVRIVNISPHLQILTSPHITPLGI